MPRAKGRNIIGNDKSCELREPDVPDGGDFAPENGLLRVENVHFWNGAL